MAIKVDSYDVKIFTPPIFDLTACSSKRFFTEQFRINLRDITRTFGQFFLILDYNLICQFALLIEGSGWEEYKCELSLNILAICQLSVN